MFNGGDVCPSKRTKKSNGEWGSDKLSHETFSLNRVYAQDDWSFCKTARKPYDLMVMIVLVLATYHFGSKFSFSSDGDDEDDYCHHAYKVINDVLGVHISMHSLID